MKLIMMSAKKNKSKIRSTILQVMSWTSIKATRMGVKIEAIRTALTSLFTYTIRMTSHFCFQGSSGNITHLD